MTHLRRAIAGLSFVAGLLVATASVQAEDSEIIVFMDSNGGGQALTIRSDIYNFGGSGYNDMASSVLVTKGTWELCNDSGYRGGCVTLSNTGSIANLDSMNDKLSSLRRVATPPGQVGNDNRGKTEIIVFADYNAAGQARTFKKETTELGGIGFNDTASSVLVLSGTWELCNDYNFRGACITVSAGSGVVNLESMNDKLSSLRPASAESEEEVDGAAILFMDSEGGGTAIRVTGDIADFNSINANDKISSIAVFSGQWQVCKNTNFRGGCTMLEPGATYELAKYDNKISSIRLVNTQ